MACRPAARKVSAAGGDVVIDLKLKISYCEKIYSGLETVGSINLFRDIFVEQSWGD